MNNPVLYTDMTGKEIKMVPHLGQRVQDTKAQSCRLGHVMVISSRKGK